MMQMNESNRKDERFVENFNNSDNEWIVVHHSKEPTVEKIEDLDGDHH